MTGSKKKERPPVDAPPAVEVVKVVGREMNVEWFRVAVQTELGPRLARLHTPRRFSRNIKINSMLRVVKPEHLDHYILDL